MGACTSKCAPRYALREQDFDIVFDTPRAQLTLAWNWLAQPFPLGYDHGNGTKRPWRLLLRRLVHDTTVRQRMGDGTHANDGTLGNTTARNIRGDHIAHLGTRALAHVFLRPLICMLGDARVKTVPAWLPYDGTILHGLRAA